MIGTLRVYWLLLRPALLIPLAMFAALGAAAAGHPEELSPLLRALLVVAGFLVAAVAVNDLSDEAVDRINLPDDTRRPLISGAGTRPQMLAAAVLGAGLALGAAAMIGPACLALVVAGLVLATVYSLAPFRLAKRGVVAPLLLPLGFVGVPFGCGLLAAGAPVHGWQLGLLGGLYLGFVGRILLKDFRDVRGDALLGKRTFLVRRGRAATCALSAACWLAGSLALLAVPGLRPDVVVGYLTLTGLALVLLRRLAGSTAPRSDEALILAIATVGRGLVLLLLAQFTLTGRMIDGAQSLVVVTGCTVAIGFVAISIARHGPRLHHLTVPGERISSTSRAFTPRKRSFTLPD